MKGDTFDVIWRAADGYAGGRRPHTITVHHSDVEDCKTKEEFRKAIAEMVQEDFEHTVSADIQNIDEACEWFKSEDGSDA